MPSSQTPSTGSDFDPIYPFPLGFSNKSNISYYSFYFHDYQVEISVQFPQTNFVNAVLKLRVWKIIRSIIKTKF